MRGDGIKEKSRCSGGGGGGVGWGGEHLDEIRHISETESERAGVGRRIHPQTKFDVLCDVEG